MPRRLDEFLQLARDRWDLAEEAEKSQREREISDLAYAAGEMWSPEDIAARSAQSAHDGLPPVAARPCIVINKLQEPLRQVTNQERQAEMGIELVPADDFAALVGPSDASEIELREGLIRRIQRESSAADARTWAFDRAAKAGRGYYGVLTRYCKGQTFDKEIYVRRFYNQASVLLDPSHEQPDGSDAQWAFVGVDLTLDEYESQFGKVNDRKNPIVGASDDEWRAYGDDAPGWFRTEGKTRIIRVVEYWYVEQDTETIVLLDDGTITIAEGVDEDRIVDRREETTQTIQFCKIDGRQVLDETEWEGKTIPIIKVLGDEVQPYDKERRAQGMVRQARGANIGFNSMVSKLVETIGNAPIPPFQATIDQVQGFEPWYQIANTRALPYLPYNLVSDNGTPLGPPVRTPVDTPIQAIVAAISMFDAAVKSTTGVPDATLGNVDPSIRSGKAIRFLQQQALHGTSNYLDNLKRSIRYEGQIISDLLYPIYGKRNRIARMLDKTGKPQVVAINGMPSGNGNGQSMRMAPGQQPPKVYQLTEDANVNVVVRVTRSYDTRRQEETEFLSDLVSSNPQLLAVYGDILFSVMDTPGHIELSERAKAMLAPPVQQMIQQQQGGMSPEVQRAIAPLQQQLAQAHALLQQAQQEISSKSASAQIQLQIAQLNAEKEFRLQTMKDATTIAAAKIAALARGVVSDNEAQVEAIALQAEQDRTAAQLLHETRAQAADHASDHVQSHLDRMHEAALQSQQLAHQSATAQIQQAADATEAEADRAHQTDLANQNADQESESESEEPQ